MTFVMLSTSWWWRDHDVTSRQVNERELWVLLPSKTQALYTSQRLQLLSNSVTNHPSNFVRIGTHEHRYILEYSKYQSLTKRFSHRSHDVTLTGVEWFTTSPHHQPLWHLFTNHQEWKQNELSNYSYRKFGDFQEWIMSQREQEHCTHAFSLWVAYLFLSFANLDSQTTETLNQTMDSSAEVFHHYTSSWEHIHYIDRKSVV